MSPIRRPPLTEEDVARAIQFDMSKKNWKRCFRETWLACQQCGRVNQEKHDDKDHAFNPKLRSIQESTRRWLVPVRDFELVFGEQA